MRHRRIAKALALAAFAFAFAFACTWACAQPGETARVQQAGTAVVFDGRIDAGSAARFLAVLAGDAGITRLVITSNGGLVGPALDMGEAIHARGLDVEVMGNCRSSCANYVFPAGRGKRIDRPGAVAWHGNMAHVLYLQRTGKGQWPEEAMAQARALAQREQAFYKRIGVDGFLCWFGKLAPYSVDDFYTLAPDDMATFSVGQVTLTADATGVMPDDVRLLTVDRLSLPRLRTATE